MVETSTEQVWCTYRRARSHSTDACSAPKKQANAMKTSGNVHTVSFTTAFAATTPAAPAAVLPAINQEAVDPLNHAADVPVDTAMFSIFSMEASNGRAKMLSMVVDSGADNQQSTIALEESYR